MKKFKTLIALLLMLAMALSLAACGSTAGNGTGNKPNSSSADKTDAETPEFAYKADYKRVNNNSNREIYPQLYTDKGFYYTNNEVVGQRELMEGETLEWEGQLDVWALNLYFSDFDGNVTKLDGFDSDAFTDSYSDDGHSFYSYINSMASDKDGNLVILVSSNESWSDPMEEPASPEEYYAGYNYHYVQEYYLEWLDASGAEVSRLSLGRYDENSEEYFYCNGLALTDSGMAVITSDNGVRVFSADGSENYEISTDYYPESIVTFDDGSMAVSMWAENGYILNYIDFEAKAFGKNVSMPNEAWYIIPGGGDYDFYYNNGSTFYGYKIAEEKSEKIFKWLDMDMNGDNMSGNMVVRDDGTVFTVYNEWDNKYENVTTDYVTISKVPYDSVPHKQALTLATMYLDWNVQNAIIKFNRTHDNVRINAIDYGEYNTEEDYEAGLTKLRTEILTGNCPDLIDLNYVSTSQLAAKGLVEDLYPFIDADSEISRDDLMSHILDVFSIDGKLYQTCSGFSISTLAGAGSVVGDTPGWTYNEVFDALQNMPEGCDILDYYTTQEEILRACLGLELSDLVNWSTGECRFDSQDFIDLLNFAKRFQSEFDWENYEWTEDDSTENRIMQGRQMLMNCYVYSFTDMLYNDYYFGNDMVFKGYPTSNGVGHLLSSDFAYAMSSKCADKDAAWEFLRLFFTEDFQTQYSYDFPTNKKVFDAKLKEAMTPYYVTDMDGNYVLDENGERIEQSRGGMGTSDGTVIEFYALSQEQADRLMELINSVDRVNENDYYDSVINIVVEQTQAFFAGQKSAEEVAKLVQNKVNIYVNEQR